MLSFVANALITPAVARRLARVIPNPFVRTLAVAAVGYGINRLVANRSAARAVAAPGRAGYLAAS
ncbi:hypothetical protein tb265_12800 [Gemmatimonadetes bacterium T265]|nr:hypothetical protein tb265_12800 [Gemmatimonadetes bacterium T265]